MKLYKGQQINGWTIIDPQHLYKDKKYKYPRILYYSESRNELMYVNKYHVIHGLNKGLCNKGLGNFKGLVNKI